MTGKPTYEELEKRIRALEEESRQDKRLLGELRESEERSRILLQVVPSMAIQGYGADGTTQYWNEASERLYGYSAQEAIGRNLLDLIIPPDMRHDVAQAIRQMADTGQAIPAAELLLMRKDGSLVPVFSSHVIVRLAERKPVLFCIDFDLTERKRIEEALRKSEQESHEISLKLQDAYLLMKEKKDHFEARKYSEGMIFLTTDEGRICGFTEEAMQMAERRHSDIQGCPIQDILVLQENQPFTDLIRKVRHGMPHLTTLKFKNRLEDGPVYEAKLTGITVENKRLFYIVLY